MSSDTTADAVLGQAGSFTTNACAGVTASALCFPGTDGDVVVDPAGNVYVAERNRILEFNTPLATDHVADRVFGQSGLFTTGVCNGPGLNESSLCTPSGLALDAAGNLYVVDADNNRALQYLTPLTTDTLADRVFGQLGFSVNNCNQGGITAASLCLAGTPLATIAVDRQGNLFVADAQNSRVLEYDAPMSDTIADRVYGQTVGFAGHICNNTGISESTLCYPSNVAVDRSGALYVVDSSNNRVLVYRDALKASVPADEVFGQNGDFGASGCPAPGASTLCMGGAVGDVAVDSAGNVYISDASQHRVLQYNTPLTTDLVADRVFGQGGSFTSNTCSLNGVSASSLCYPTGLAVDSSGNLFIVEPVRNRVLGYLSPLTTDTVADLVFGQSGSFTGSDCNSGGVNETTLCMWNTLRGDVAVDNAGNVYIADTDNSRVLRFNTPFTTDRTADSVLGQANMGSFGCNAGGTTASSLCAATGVAVDTSGNVYVADAGNSRALTFYTPASTDTVADAVFGQVGSFTTIGCNTGGLDAASLCLGNLVNPYGSVALDTSGNLFIADTLNQRLLEYDAPATTDTVADRVYGHVSQDFTVDRCNNGGVSRAGLCRPHGIAFGPDGSLYVTDNLNNRVLVFAAGADVDSDGCSDVEEFRTDQSDGGSRDPDNSGAAYYNGDLNGDGLMDGRQLDRTPNAVVIWQTGPPTGAISIADVSAAVAQVGHRCDLAP